MSTRYGLYCRDCQQATENGTYLADGLREVLLVSRYIALIQRLTKDIEISVLGWQESEDMLWTFLDEHGEHHRVIVIDEYGYPVFQTFLPHERLPIKAEEHAS